MVLFAGFEAGGTSFRVSVARDSAANIVAQWQVATTTPAATIGACVDWLQAKQSELGEDFAAVGVASFGPVDVRKGLITTTPKPGWAQTDVLGPLRAAFPAAKLAFDTDVNGAALGQLVHGADPPVSSLVYITVGTGIGAGIVVDGRPLHGKLHPEAGHMFVQRHADDTTFKGTCPFHGACVEGLVASPSMAERAGVPKEDLGALADDHAAFVFGAYYLAQLCVNLTLAVSPLRIVIGGGIMNRTGLLDNVRKHFVELLAGYVPVDDIAAYITRPPQGDDAGVVGSLELAVQVLAGTIESR